MTYRHVKLPASGEKVTIRKGKVQVPDQPIIGYVEGPARHRRVDQGAADHAGRRWLSLAERVTESDIFNAFEKFSENAE